MPLEDTRQRIPAQFLRAAHDTCVSYLTGTTERRFDHHLPLRHGVAWVAQRRTMEKGAARVDGDARFVG